jgi:hypothetical protein
MSALKIPKAYLQASAALKTKDRESERPRYQHVKADASLQDVLRTKSVDNVNRGEEVFDADREGGAKRIKELYQDQTGELMPGKMDYETWLPFAAVPYKLSPRIEDYIIVNTLVCPSDIPNRNGIAFPARELATFHPPPMNRQSFKAWGGCPIHLEHDNEIHDRAYGVMLDAALTKVTGYGGGKLWKVMGLIAIDKTKYPDMAMQVLKKLINTYSMGALVDRFTCGFCGTECTSRQVCSHITSPANVNWREFKHYDGQNHLAFLNAHGIQPIECSIVKDPAWAPALSDEVFDPWEQVKDESPILTKKSYTYPFDN